MSLEPIGGVFAPLRFRAVEGNDMIIGYARTSTLEQVAGFEAQERELRANGAEKVFKEQVSSVGHREQLDRALEFAREGDTLVVTKLDRLARSMWHLADILKLLEHKKVALRILAMGLDTSTPTGKLMLNVMGSVAQFEREMMLERQREGIAKAKSEGKYTGRKPTAIAKAAEVHTLIGAGASVAQVSKELGISETSIYRIVKSTSNNERSSGAAAPEYTSDN